MSSKSRIESEAHETVQKSGLKTLSFRTLGAQVGVKSSSVHYHFPEKSDLAEALLNRYRIDLLTTLRKFSEQSPSAYASIRHFNHTFIERCNQGKMCFAGMMAAEVESLTDANRENLSTLLQEIQKWLTQEFERAANEVIVPLPASTLAKVLLASLEGGLLLDRAQNSDNHLDAVNSLVASWFGKTNQ